MNFDYSTRTVIVTGGIRGIGRAVTEAFLKSGASVVATYVSNDTAAEKFKKEWSDHPLELAKFDVSDYEKVEKFFFEFDKKHDALYALVNCAGIRKDNVVGMMPPEDWNSVLSTNLSK